MSDSNIPPKNPPAAGISTQCEPASVPTTVTLRQLFNNLVTRLNPIAAETATQEAEQILTYLLQFSRIQLYTNFNRPVPVEKLSPIESFIKRRLTQEPLQYILGRCYFYNKEFLISPDVLIPRPDTECLVECILHHEKEVHCFFCDLGCGSGIIAATLCAQRPKWRCLATDISEKALAVASKNCSSPVSFLCMDRLSSLKTVTRIDQSYTGFDFIVSNPPYIARRDLKTLEHSVIAFEPIIALDGGDDGLDFYRYLADEGRFHLNPHGTLYCEIGYTQAAEVMALFQSFGWKTIVKHTDLAGRDRIIRCQL
ncbi:MAG: peptide chain release factor N(5)-glutamine methyltransferase [Chitinivibrionales bacterium]|nr:peptide chain release factor N(5)-glutamine methyltransferase [Chitinivibrionales bacterium]